MDGGEESGVVGRKFDAGTLRFIDFLFIGDTKIE